MQTVLVVDDEPLALELMKSILDKRGFRVLDTTDPLEALKMFQSVWREVDLLITDVRMPALDGPSLAERIIDIKPALPVLFVSGYASEEEIDRTDLATRFAFLAKPFRPASLVQAVMKMLETEDAA